MAAYLRISLGNNQPMRKNREFRRHSTALNDNEYRMRYRFGRQGIEKITDLVREDLEKATSRSRSLTVEEQVLLALRFYASGNFLQVIGDTMGFDKSTVSRAVTNVTDALVKHSGNFIRWPVADREKTIIKQGFYHNGGFPHVIGAIDGTHVRIISPTHDEPSFVNRKGYHSINVQAVCDHIGKFTNINAMWPGCSHDAHIFRSSQVRTHMEQHGGFDRGIILGDSGYPCKPYLLTPYRITDMAQKELYNRRHCKTRCTIERTFGVWKRRFHVLHSEIRMKPSKVCRIIIACAVLHNIAIDLNEPLMDEEDGYVDLEQPHVEDYNGREDGNRIRDHYANTFLMQMYNLMKSPSYFPQCIHYICLSKLKCIWFICHLLFGKKSQDRYILTIIYIGVNSSSFNSNIITINRFKILINSNIIY